jgi:hypothetical protein
MIRRVFWMATGAALAYWVAQRLKQLRPASAADSARRLRSDVGAALAAGRDAKRRTESDMWAQLGNDVNGAPQHVIEVPDEPFAPLRNALGQSQPRR